MVDLSAGTPRLDKKSKHDIELVVHVDPPAEHKAYLHRSGRTARAQATKLRPPE